MPALLIAFAIERFGNRPRYTQNAANALSDYPSTRRSRIGRIPALSPINHITSIRPLDALSLTRYYLFYTARRSAMPSRTFPARLVMTEFEHRFPRQNGRRPSSVAQNPHRYNHPEEPPRLSPSLARRTGRPGPLVPRNSYQYEDSRPTVSPRC